MDSCHIRRVHSASPSLVPLLCSLAASLLLALSHCVWHKTQVVVELSSLVLSHDVTLIDWRRQGDDGGPTSRELMAALAREVVKLAARLGAHLLEEFSSSTLCCSAACNVEAASEVNKADVGRRLYLLLLSAVSHPDESVSEMATAGWMDVLEVRATPRRPYGNRCSYCPRPMRLSSMYCSKGNESGAGCRPREATVASGTTHFAHARCHPSGILDSSACWYRRRSRRCVRIPRALLITPLLGAECPPSPPLATANCSCSSAGDLAYGEGMRRPLHVNLASTLHRLL